MVALLTGLVFWFGGGGGSGEPQSPQFQATEKVVIVDVDVATPADVDKCYLSSYDKKKVELTVEWDDTLNSLQDFIYEEDPIEGPGCFMPEMKLVYKDYTYVVSLYCTSVKKYRNSAPYVTSATKMPNDLEVTETVLAYLKKMHRKYFGPLSPPGVCEKFIQREPLQADGNNGDDIAGDDDDDHDPELEKDANDQNGLFDNLNEPDDEIIPVEPDDE